MKKTVLIGGAALMAIGFFTLTAFGGKTKAQQEADIAKAVTEQVDAFRQEKIAECDERVAAAAQAKYDEMLAAAPAETKPAPGKKTAPKGKGGPKVDPLPQPAPPKPATEESKAKGRIGGESPVKAEEEKAKSRVGGQAPVKEEEKKAKSRIGGGGN